MQNQNISTNQSSLFDSLILYTKLFNKPFTKEALISGLPIEGNINLFSKDSSKSLFSRVAKKAGLKSTLIKRDLEDLLQLQLPMIILLTNGNSCILETFNDDRTQAKIILPEAEDGLVDWVDIEKLENEYLGFGFLLKKEFDYSSKESNNLKIKSKHWFWGTINLSSKMYKDVIWASLLINIFILATPLFTMNVYDRVIPNNAQETLIVFSIGIIFVYILDLFLKTTRTYMLEMAAKRSDIIMSSIIFEKVLDLKMAMHPRSVGSFANNLKDFESVRSFFTNATMTAIIDLPFAVIFLAVIFYIGGALVLVPMVTMAIILGYALYIRKPLQESIESSYAASAKKNGILVETLQNIETVKTMSMAGKKQWEWEESTGEIAEKNLHSRKLSASIPIVTNLFIQLNTVFVIIFGVYLIQEFELTMGGLIAVIILTSRTVAPMGQAAALITNYANAKTSYQVLNDIVNREVERPDGKQFVEKTRFDGKIEFQNVSFKYPDSDMYALKNVSFVINPDEKVAFIGRIGSGKSTIIKLLLRLYDPTEGTILVDDIDISQIDPADLRRYLGYVPQDVNLFNGTIKDNIISTEHSPAFEDIIEASKISTSFEFISTHPLGFDMPIAERGQGLSGGQRQSVGIARALMKNSSVMLLDEPTNAMDTTTEKKILNNFKSEFEDKTVLLVTQKLSLLDIVDRIIVMKSAVKVLDGPKKEVMAKLSGAKND